MGLRTSVTGCISLLGIVSVATGCSGQAPGQASLARLGLSGGAGMALARQLVSSPGLAGKTPAMAIADAEQVLKAASPTDVKALAALAHVASTVEAAPKDATPAIQPAVPAVVAGIETPAVAPAMIAEIPQTLAAEPPPAVTKPIETAADGTFAAPAFGFTLGGLLDAALPADTEAATNILFHDGFQDGLAAWVSRGLGLPVATATTGQDAVVLSGTRARKSLWIKTRTEIDLAASNEPRLRLDFKGAPVAIKAVWETDTGSFPEEILLAAVEPDADAPKDAAPEFDLSALRGRPGHLVLVARAPKGTDRAPVLDAVTIYDAEKNL